MKAIEISKLSKTFRVPGGRAVNALKDVSFSVEPGEVFGFLGPNGAGKSTTIKILMGLIRPTGGHAHLMGQDVQSHRSRCLVGYLPENPAFYDFLTAHEYLLFAGKTFGLNGDALQAKIDDILKLLELRVAKNRPLRGYSKGMIQRLGLAQALIHDPDVYILDEPMSGLDPLGRALIKQIIRELKSRGKCIFFSTHITSDVEAVCDRVGIILNGALQRVERVDVILAEGIIGYRARTQGAGALGPADRYVPRDELGSFMKEALDAKLEIISLEPERKDLETFFLDIVKGVHAD